MQESCHGGCVTYLARTPLPPGGRGRREVPGEGASSDALTLHAPRVDLSHTAGEVYRVRRLPLWAVSWLQVSSLALVLLVLFALPTILFLVVSFFDYDRVGIYPAFIWDNYRELLTTPATLRVYISSLKFAFIVWAITLFLGFNIAYFLIFHVRSATVRTVLFLMCAI